MSYNQYSGYGGNPYEQQSGGYGASNPYGDGAGNPYSQQQQSSAAPPGAGLLNHPTTTQHQDSSYTQTSQYSQTVGGQQYSQTGGGQQYSQTGGGQQYSQTGGSQQYTPTVGGQPYGAAPPPQPHDHPVEYVAPSANVMSNSDFLSRVEAVKADIRTLTTHVDQIAALHQRTLSAPDGGSSAQLESMITSTQVLNTSIKDQIKQLEKDAVQSRDNQVKHTQIGQLKGSFTKQLQEYRVEEANYEKRYREQIARQYRIVNPDATDAEIKEAADADWGNEGVFQTALKTNRSATANTVLGAVRARHNDIQKIERTLLELGQLMEELATAVVLQEAAVQQTEQHTERVKQDTEAGNVQLDKGIAHARRARKLKWWCFFIVLAIIVILGLVLGLFFGLQARNNSTNNSGH